MAELRQLTSNEVLFVGGESSNVYQHTSGLVVLDGEGRPGFGVSSIRRHLEERIARIPHFRWRLHEVPFGLDLPYWVEDEDFSFDHHIHRVALPRPGDRDALAALTSYLYSRHLDRRRPLWETWIIEGLEDGRLALFSKLHHCMMDGEGANQLGMAINDLEPDPTEPLPIDPAIIDALPGATPDPVQQTLNAARHLSSFPIRATREVVGAALDSVRKLAASESDVRTPTPATPFNGRIGRDRGLVFCSLSLTDVKAVKDHHDVTVNDVLLAIVGGSVRRYLIERNVLPDSSLRTAIAISLRADGELFGNKVTTASVTLATDIADPVDRLRAIAADSERAKRRARAGGKGYLEMVGLFPPVVVGAMVAATPPALAAQAAGANLLLSTVKGSPIPLYIGGGRVTAMYPMSIVTSGLAVNATCVSYVDEIFVGVTIDPHIIDSPWVLVDTLDDELAALRPRARRRARSRSNG